MKERQNPSPERNATVVRLVSWTIRSALRAKESWRPLLTVLLMVLVIGILLGSTVPVAASPALLTPATPTEPASVRSTDYLRSVPTPAGVPAGLTPMTQANHPCWVINPNGSSCIQVDLANWTNPDVIPNPLSGQLNTSWKLYPYDDQDIHFQVLSTYNLGYCNNYNPPWQAGGGSSCSGGQGPSAMYSGWSAWLFLTVIDVMWQDVCWYCSTDGTQWHANAGADWAPTQSEPYVGKVPTDPTSTLNNWVSDLNISAFGGNGAPNFPNGTWVMWNITENYWNGSSTAGFHRIQYCAPECGGGLQGGMFYYFTRNFWFYDNTPPGGFPPYGPNCGQCTPNPFSANVNLTYSPVVPNVGDTVNVDLRTQPIENLTGALFDTDATILVLNAWYPNGTFWRTWVSGFTPLAYPYNTSWHEHLILPADFFAHSGTRIEWFVQAYDQYGHLIQSQNFTQIVSTIGVCPNTNFTACLNVTTDPGQIDTEGWNGWLPTTPASIPGVDINTPVNVTITTLSRAVDIEAAYVILHVIYSTTGGSGTGLYTLHRVSLNLYYFDIPALPEGTNVTFVIKAIDFNETSLISHPYRFFVPFSVATPEQYCFFYVQVYNAATAQPINGANVTITAESGTLKIKTTTSLDGVAYPNVTGQQWTPRFLPAGQEVTVKVQVSGFYGVGLPAPFDTIQTNFVCQHIMDNTSVLTAGANYQVVLRNSVLNFSLNSAYSPPVFSAAVYPPISLAMDLGMLAAAGLLIPVFLIWRRQREIAAAEEKRVTL